LVEAKRNFCYYVHYFPFWIEGTHCHATFITNYIPDNWC
jgi:hypothetical protein